MKRNRMGTRARVSVFTTVWLGSLLAMPAWSQKAPNFPITPEQSSTAKKVAQAGVPLADLAPDAPDTYVVKSGDTLWAISKMYLRSPWRWPELWGMNIEEILNPHLIYPGQTLYLEKRDGRARLTGTPPGSSDAPAGGDTQTTEPGAATGGDTAGSKAPADGRGGEGIETVRLSPRVRSSEARPALTTLQTRSIEPFLAEPLIVEEREFLQAPRIVAADENRVMIGRGDRVYARGPADAPMLDDQRKLKQYRLFRNAKALKDPDSGELLGFEAEFLGKAVLVRSEGTTEVMRDGEKASTVQVPATIDVLTAKSEIFVGDRLVPEQEREFLSFTPRAPESQVNGRIVSIYGSSAVVNASQNQVVVLNRGKRDGMASGHVLAILKDGRQLTDRTDPGRPVIKLPNERNGLLMVFRVFDKVSYGLILEINDTVRVGDRVTSPQ